MASSIFDLAAQASPDALDFMEPAPLSAPKPAPITPAPTFRTLLDNAVINIPNSSVDWSSWEKKGIVPPLEAAQSLKLAEDKFGPLESWDRETIRAWEPDITSVSEYYRRMTKNDEGQSQGMLDYLDDIEAFGKINRFTDAVFEVDDATGNKTIKPEAFEAMDLDRRTKDLLALTQDYEQNPNIQMRRDAFIRHLPLFGEMLQSMDAGEAITGPRLLKKFEDGTITDGETRELARIMAWNRTIAQNNENSPTYRRMMQVQRTLGEALIFGTGAGALSKLATTNLGKTAMIAFGAPVFSPRAYSDVINRYANGDSFSTALADGYVTSAIESGVEFWGGKLIGKSFEKLGQLFKGKPTKAAVQSGLSKWMESTGLGKLSISGFAGEIAEERLQEVVGGYAAMVSGRDWGDPTMGFTGAAARGNLKAEHWEQLLVEVLSIGTMMGSGHLASKSEQQRIADFNAKTQFLFDNLDKFPALQKEFASPTPYSRRKGPEMFKAVGLPNTTKEFREAVREKANRLVAGEAGPLEQVAGQTRTEESDAYFQQMQTEFGPPPVVNPEPAVSPDSETNRNNQTQTETTPVQPPEVQPPTPPAPQPEFEYPEPTFNVQREHKDLAAEFPVLPPNAVYAILEEEKRVAEAGYAEFDQPRREWLADRLNAGQKVKSRFARLNKLLDKIQHEDTDSASISGFDELATDYLNAFYGEEAISTGEGRVWEELKQLAGRHSTFGWKSPDLIERTRQRVQEMLTRGDFDNRPIAEDPDYAPEPGMPFDRTLKDQAVSPENLPDEPPILQNSSDVPPWQKPPSYREAETPGGDLTQPIPTDLLVATLRQLGVAIESGKLKGARGQYDIANIQVIIDRETTTDPDQFRKTVAHELAHAIDYFEFDDWVKQFGSPTGAAGLPAILNAVEVLKRFVTSSKLLAKNNDVRLGLIQFSENWRGPWDRNDKEMHKYRSDVRELWADYVGAMLISPQDAATGAPIVWEKLFEQLFEPQNAKYLKAYQDMQAVMTNTKSYTEEMLKIYRESRIDAREKALRMKAMEDAEVAKNEWGWGERIYNALFDSKGLIRRKVDAIGGEEEFNLLSSQYDSIMSDYHRTIREQVYKPINELGMDEETFGTYLQWNRVASDGRGIHEVITDEDGNEMFVLTGMLHNPLADTARDAQRKIAGLRQVIGEQGMQTLQQAAQVFYDNNFAIMELAYNTGIISQASWELVNLNRNNYVTFRIGEYASRNLAPSVKKMYGTMKDIVDPVTATIQQMGAFTRFALNNRLNNMAVSALSLEGLVYQKNPQTPGFDTVTVMEGGRPKTYWVPRKYAYEMNRPTPSPVAEGIARFNSLPIVMEIRKLFTAFRPDFYAPNAYRDFMRTLSNFTAASGVRKRDLIKQLPHAFMESYRYVTGKGSAEIVEAMREGAIPIHSEINDRTALIERDEVLQTYVELDHKSMFEKIPYVGRIFTALNKAGMASEMFSKLAAWNAAKKAGLSNKRAAYLVKSHAGTPDTSIRGSLASVLNTVFMFNSVKMSAMREDFNLATGKHGKEAQKRYAINQAILFAPRLAPTIMKWSVLALIAMGIKDEWLDEMKAAYDLEESVPASTRENNHVFVLGIGADGKLQTLTIPKTETQRQLEAFFNLFVSEELGAEVGVERGSFIRMMMGDGGGEDFLRNVKTAFTWGATDINVAPVLEVPLKWGALVLDPSKPPTDWFTGRPINNISPDEWSQMGGIARSAQMADWSFNKFGVVGDVKDMALLMAGYYNGDETKFLNAVPVLNRFYRKYNVSDYQAIEEASAEIHKNSQEWSFSRGDNTRRAMSEISRMAPLSDAQLEDVRSGLPRERHLLNGMNRWAYTPAQALFKESTDEAVKEQIQTQLDAKFDEFYRLLRQPKAEKEMLAKFPGAFSWTLNKLATKPEDADWSVSAMRDTHLWKTIESSGMTGPQAIQILTSNYKVGKQSLQRLSALFGAAE